MPQTAVFGQQDPSSVSPAAHALIDGSAIFCDPRAIGSTNRNSSAAPRATMRCFIVNLFGIGRSQKLTTGTRHYQPLPPRLLASAKPVQGACCRVRRPFLPRRVGTDKKSLRPTSTWVRPLKWRFGQVFPADSLWRSLQRPRVLRYARLHRKERVRGRPP